MTPTEVKKLNKKDLVEYAESLGVKGDFETLTKAEIQKLISEDADYSEATEEVKEDESEQPEEGTDESDEELLEDSETPEEEAVQEDGADDQSEEDEVDSDAENELLAKIVKLIETGNIGQRAGAGFYRMDPEGNRTLMMNVHRVVYNAVAAGGIPGLVEAAEHPHHTIEAGCAVYNARQHGQVYLRCNATSKMYLLKRVENLNEDI